MKHNKGVAGIALAVALAVAAGSALADRGRGGMFFHAKLEGFQEVPVVSTAGEGSFRARLSRDGQFIEWELEYSGIATTPVQAHIHLGQHSVNGGITVWLCQSATNPAPAAVSASVATCSPSPAHFTGTITATSVVGPGGPQQLGAGELAELIRAMREGVTYVNVHTSVSPGGEIRGQIK
jgi:hypothetical protein